MTFFSFHLNVKTAVLPTESLFQVLPLLKRRENVQLQLLY